MICLINRFKDHARLELTCVRVAGKASPVKVKI